MRPVLLFFPLIFIFVACKTIENPIESSYHQKKTENDFELDYSDDKLEIIVPKWYKNHKSAVSITYDAAWEGSESYLEHLYDVINEIRRRGMNIDFECVTSKYDNPAGQKYLETMKELNRSGIHFFGHGHEHIQYDLVDYDSAFYNMGKCFNLMKGWGLNPKTYAYPGSSYRKESTRRACRDAGFIGGRGGYKRVDSAYIHQFQLRDEDFRFGLPSLVMGKVEGAYHDHAGVEKIINNAHENESWIIFMYHNIGISGSYGWYEWEQFIKDLDLLERLDYWSVNMDDAICYIQERNNLSINLKCITEKGNELKYKFVWSDSLDNKIYNHPLSLRIRMKNNNIVDKVLLDKDSSIATVSINGSIIELEVYPDEKEHLITILNRQGNNKIRSFDSAGNME